MTVYRRGSKARFTLHTAPYVDEHTWTYGTVSRCTLMQDTADANYMLLSVVVNGHNCSDGRQRDATCRKLDLSGVLRSVNGA